MKKAKRRKEFWAAVEKGTHYLVTVDGKLKIFSDADRSEVLVERWVGKINKDQWETVYKNLTEFASYEYKPEEKGLA